MSHRQHGLIAEHIFRLTVDTPSGGLDINLSCNTIEVCESGSSRGYVGRPAMCTDTSEAHDTGQIKRRLSETRRRSNAENRFLPIPSSSMSPPSIAGRRLGRDADVFLINLIVTIWAAARYDIENGIGTIHDGSCDSTKSLSLWSHLAINVLSTALLSASNYCMQCLSAPTRGDIDRAHGRHVWLNVGVQSVRNLFHVSRTRALLWFLLALSSIPLHLFYNSAIFSTLSAREYDILTISPNLAAGKFFNVTAVPPDAFDPGLYDHSFSDELAFPPFSHSRLVKYGLDLLTDVNNASIWQRMNNKDCIQKYGQEFISTRGDFLAVSHALNDSFPIKFVDTAYPKTENGGGPSYHWMCDLYPEAKHGINNEQCRLNLLLPKATEWAIRSNRRNYPITSTVAWQPDPVDYCLSRRVEENCRLQFSLTLLILVIVCNFIKAACMISMVYRQDAQPLVTLGDAIASFLNDPDSTTQGNCLATKHHFPRHEWAQQPCRWATKDVYWFRSLSWTRWALCNVLSILTLIATAALLGSGVSNERLADNSFKGLWELGYGTVTFRSLLSADAFPINGSLVLPIFVANFPQLLLSFLYLTYNDLFTCMLLCREWTGYAQHRKPLRVTRPMGKQRSTYSLQLPYSYGIPLVLVSGALHWLVSQSIFLARITVFDSLDREDERYSVSTCGYSCIAIISVIFVSTTTLVAGIANGFRKYPAGMTLAGSNSAAISAACHAPAEDVSASVLPVKWGAVWTEGKIGHCCFTSFEVTPPVVGEFYAGLGANRGEGRAYRRSLHGEAAC
ncbi:MAG: hypothetical protein Q9208_008642 [Pyrenodesmia sp. 3 TL-2023]